jgi:hypothetical protein
VRLLLLLQKYGQIKGVVGCPLTHSARLMSRDTPQPSLLACAGLACS